jgi:L-lactate dehydrogenase complex protein LldE
VPETVQLFVTCIVDTLYPEIGEAVVRVLERTGVRRNGLRVEFPGGQTCCGQPAFNAGMRLQARSMAIHTIQVFEETPGPVVIPSGSCAAMIRHGYLELFAEDAEWLPRAQALAARTYEFSEFLGDYLKVVDFGARCSAPLAYHPSCHLARDLGVDRQPRALLAALRIEEEGDGDERDRPAKPGLVDLPHSEECCGFGGVFAVEHPEISSAMLERKIANIEASGASLVVTCDAGCITHINGGLHRQGKPQRAVHISQVLDKT